MAQLPSIKRLIVEDFPSQTNWIGKLLQPMNTFMTSMVSALQRNLTLKDNLSADAILLFLDRVPTISEPYRVAWALTGKRPLVVIVGNVQRNDRANLTLTNAVQVQWDFDVTLNITNVVGVTPTASIPYIITVVAFTG